MTRTLFDMNNIQAANIADGTCNLVKPFVLCCTNGYIIDVFGPYSAKINDSTILLDLRKTKI